MIFAFGVYWAALKQGGPNRLDAGAETQTGGPPVHSPYPLCAICKFLPDAHLCRVNRHVTPLPCTGSTRADRQHVFHTKCLLGWTRRGNNTCPECRDTVPEPIGWRVIPGGDYARQLGMDAILPEVGDSDDDIDLAIRNRRGRNNRR